MDTIVPEGHTQPVEGTAKRKRHLDEDDDCERPRKHLHASQSTDSDSGVNDSSTTIVGNVSVGAVKRTDSDATAVGSNASSQTTTSNSSSSTVTCEKPVVTNSSRSPVRPPSISAAGLPASTSSPKPLGSRPPSRPAILGNSAALNAAGPSAPSAPQGHKGPPPAGTMASDASNVSAADFRSPEPVVVVSVRTRSSSIILLKVRKRQAYAAHHSNYLHPLPWGVQWEIARYVNTGFDYHRFKVEFLRGLEKHGKNTTAAPEVTKYVEDERQAEKAQAESEAALPDAPAAGGSDSTSDEFAAAYAREQSARVRAFLPGQCDAPANMLLVASLGRTRQGGRDTPRSSPRGTRLQRARRVQPG